MLLQIVTSIRDAICFSPIYLGLIAGIAILLTVALKGVQFRYFFKSWKLALGSSNETTTTTEKGDMSVFQAFLSALNISIGNGCLAGVAAALHIGGPGVVFWMFCAGALEMVFRFAEVFLSVSFSKLARNKTASVLGGPFLYIDKLPFGAALATLYAICCFIFGLVGGNAMQCNSISTVLQHTFHIPASMIAIALGSFVLYVMFGGAKRIVKISDTIIPFKVGLFFITILLILGYYRHELLPALWLIFESAFYPKALAGAAVGMGVRQMIGLSISRTVNACEAGLGTAAIFYGNTNNSNPMKDALTSMLSVFMSINVVTLLVSLALIASGVWNGNADGAALVAQAYESVFGIAGGYIVTALTMIFGLGVFVPYGYIARQCWLYITNGKYETLFIFIFTGAAITGSLMSIELVWTMIDIIVACLLTINLSAVLFLLGYLRSNSKL